MSNFRPGSKSNRDRRFMVVEERYWKSVQKKSRKSLEGSDSSSSLSSDSSGRSPESFTRRCSSLIKEQRARFYIMRRCVIMLLCWNGDA